MNSEAESKNFNDNLFKTKPNKYSMKIGYDKNISNPNKNKMSMNNLP